MKFQLGEPQMVGKFQPRQDLEVKGPPRPGLSVQVVKGTDVYRPHDGTPWPPQDIKDVRQICAAGNLIVGRDEIKEGEEVLVQCLFGFSTCTVHIHSEDGRPYAVTPDKQVSLMLDFDEEHPDGPRWVCTGSANLRALRRLQLEI